MAERRMFSKAIIDSDTFLNMPLSAQALYFHLSMRADDDGFVSNPHKIQRMLGASDDDFKLLLAKNYVVLFDSGVVVMVHWLINNYIQKDRYHPTDHQNEKALLDVDESRMYTACIQNVYRLDTNTKIEDNLQLDSSPPPKSKPARRKYGEYGHVRLTDEQYAKLVDELGESETADYIRKVDEYCQQHGKTYKDYNLTIRNWVRRDIERNGSAAGIDPNTDRRDTGKYSTVF